jgi:hypothetical protein
MRIFSLISGWYFCDLQAHGKEMDQVIARGDNSLVQHSTPELSAGLINHPPNSPAERFPAGVCTAFLPDSLRV